MEVPIVLGMTITPKQQLFAQEYLLDLNATHAATRAGYSPATAYSQGQRLLKNVEVQKKIQAAMDRRAERTGITAERVFRELAAIGFSNMGDYLTVKKGIPTIDLENLTPDQMAAIRVIKIGPDSGGQRQIHVKLRDKLGALIVLARHLGMINGGRGRAA